jgi:DUF1680 family protein
MNITWLSAINPTRTNSHYPGNRAPLRPEGLQALPLGAIKPGGWLKEQLELMTRGMVGKLHELSDFLTDDTGWLGGDGEAWEEQPYWLRGFYDLGVLTENPDIQAESRRWIEAMVAGQDTSGYFGGRREKRMAGGNGRFARDLWPHMVMIDALRSHYEAAGDDRIIPMLTRFFASCRDLPENEFIPSRNEDFPWKISIQYDRAGDMLPHIYWLYNRCGDEWLLSLAKRFYTHLKPAESEWLDKHIVHFTQRFSYPGIYSQQSGRKCDFATSEYWYNQHMGTWGQQARGLFGADEQIRSGKTDPRQGFETCGMVEFAKSFYLLGRISGDTVWADRCEDIMLNHFSAAQDLELKGLHYLTASNLPQLDGGNQHDFFNEDGTRDKPQLPYSPYVRYRCCQHNVAMGWPWYVKHSWLATYDDGLAVWLYTAGEVEAKVGTGEVVRIVCRTEYPFTDRIEFTFDVGAEFPFYLRVPRWATSLTLRCNGSDLYTGSPRASWLRIDNRWGRGDTLELEFEMHTELTHWLRTGAVTVEYGPFSYTPVIQEDWRRWGGTDEWPEWEVYPASPWNYALVLDPDDPATWPVPIETADVPEQPWTHDAAPVRLKAKAKRVPGWTLNRGMVGELPGPDAVKDLDTPVEEIVMIPLGCARLRMACLPWVKPD